MADPFGIICIFLLLLFASCTTLMLLPEWTWKASSVFFSLNKLQWWLHNPLRPIFRDNRKGKARIIYIVFFPAFLVWWILIYIICFPLRVFNSLYFNVILLLSVNLRDRFADLVFPKTNGFRFLKGRDYYFKWMQNLPRRLAVMIFRSFAAIAQSVAMFMFDLLWPSLTLFHGTGFQSASVPITQSGKWRVGREDFVGTGIYFAIDPKVAAHYSGVMQPSIIVARVTLTFLRPVATLGKKIRTRAGAGGNGDLISQNSGFLTGALEHWRHDRGGWYEFCLVYPNKKGQFIRSWRIRPICVLPLNKSTGKTGIPERIWSGTAFWPLGKAAVLLLFLTICTLVSGVFITINFGQFFPQVLNWF